MAAKTPATKTRKTRTTVKGPTATERKKAAIKALAAKGLGKTPKPEPAKSLEPVAVTKPKLVGYKYEQLKEMLARPSVNESVRFDGDQVAIIEGHAHAIAATLATKGQPDIGITHLNEDGTEDIISGNHRAAAYVMLHENPEAFGVEIKNRDKLVFWANQLTGLTREEQLEEALRANAGRNNTVMDLVQFARASMDTMKEAEKGAVKKTSWEAKCKAIAKGLKRVAGEMGINAGVDLVVKLLLISEYLPPEFAARLHRGDRKFNMSVAVTTCRMIKDKVLDRSELLSIVEDIAEGRKTGSYLSKLWREHQRRAHGKSPARSYGDWAQIVKKAKEEYTHDARLDAYTRFMRGDNIPESVVVAILSDDDFDWTPPVTAPDGRTLAEEDEDTSGAEPEDEPELITSDDLDG